MRDFDLLGESVPKVRVSARTLAFPRILNLFSLPSFYLCIKNIYNIYIHIYIYITADSLTVSAFRASSVQYIKIERRE